MNRILFLMPFLAIIAASLGYFLASDVAHYKSALVPVIAIIMGAMGLTLTASDFTRALAKPLPVFIGVLLQFLLMPLLAWLISKALALPNALLIGMILVGTAPGGTASNVMTYLAGGKVALSVIMTTFSTLISILATPWLTGLYLSEVVAVDQWGMLVSMVKIVLLPVLAGVIIRTLLPGLVKKVQPVLPILAVLGICFAIAIVVALNASKIGGIGVAVILAVIMHNLSGFVSGYGLARLCRFDLATCRTVAIEVGMQNSGLATVLAIKHFNLMAAIPPALFSVVQNVFGMLLATVWSRTSNTNPAFIDSDTD